MKLVAEISDPTLLLSLAHRNGSTFYMESDGKDGDDKLLEVVYFSRSKIVHFVGKLDQEQKKLLQATATLCTAIEFDPMLEVCRILQ